MPLRLLIQALLLVFGGWWCKEIVGRIPSDIKELKEPDTARRVVIMGMWIVTIVILFFMIQFAWNLALPAIQAFSKR